MPKLIPAAVVPAHAVSQMRTQSVSQKESRLLPLFSDIAMSKVSDNRQAEFVVGNSLVVKLRDADFQMGPHKNSSGAYFGAQSAARRDNMAMAAGRKESNNMVVDSQRTRNSTALADKISQLRFSNSSATRQVLALLLTAVAPVDHQKMSSSSKSHFQGERDMLVAERLESRLDADGELRLTNGLKIKSHLQELLKLSSGMSGKIFRELAAYTPIRVGPDCQDSKKAEARSCMSEKLCASSICYECVGEQGVKAIRFLQQMETGPPDVACRSWKPPAHTI